LLKGHDTLAVLPELWPLLAFLLMAGAVAMKRYRQTLD
jgi:ABC-2 type transport system permease protein